LIRTSVGPDAVFYRCITPKWAHQPTSGEGAAVAGGRFNRPGLEALYLATDVETAIAEYRQDSVLLQPAMVVAFQVTLQNLVDFSLGFAASNWLPDWKDWSTNWRRIARIDHAVPPSWLLADAVFASGAAEVLYPSLRNPSGTNLVIFPTSLGPADRITAHDPDGLLPRDQTSWA